MELVTICTVPGAPLDAPFLDASPPTRASSPLDLPITLANRKAQHLRLSVQRPLLQSLIRGLVRSTLPHFLLRDLE